MLLVRHREVPNVPFIQLDKDTLEQINSDQPFSCEDDLLNWQPREDYVYNTEIGTRALRHAPFCTDGEFVYLMVRHYSTRIGDGLIRVTIEKYKLEGRHFTRLEE